MFLRVNNVLCPYENKMHRHVRRLDRRGDIDRAYRRSEKVSFLIFQRNRYWYRCRRLTAAETNSDEFPKLTRPFTNALYIYTYT